MKKLLLSISFVLLSCQLAYGVADEYYVTTTGAGDKTGTEWAKAFSLTEFEADAEGNAEAGDVYYVEEGIYTLTQDFICLNDGTKDSYIKIIGVKSGTSNEPPVYADYAFTTARPLFDTDGNAYDWEFDDYWHIENIRLSTADALGWDTDIGCKMINCKAVNSAGEAFRAWENDQVFIGCEGNGTDQGFLCASQTALFGCYAHDSTIGIQLGSNDSAVIGCIVDTCTTGILFSATVDDTYIVNNTIYNCTTGISATDTEDSRFANNIFDECTAPANWTGAEASNYWDYNSWDGDSGANTNVTIGNNAIDSDITLTDAGNGDFTLQSGSACLDAGLQIGTNEGVKGDSKVNIGVDQDDVAAAAGVTANGAITVAY